MIFSRRIAYAALAAPLALALSACNGGEEEASLEGEAIADIPAPDGQQWTNIAQQTEEGGYLLGNPDAPLKLVEYGSLTCGACANFVQTGAEQLKNEYVASGVVSFELRNTVRSGFDLALVRLTRCGPVESVHPLNDQVWLNFDEVMTSAQQGAQSLENADIPEGQEFLAMGQAAGFLDFFAARGISRDQGAACLADGDAMVALGEELGERADADSVTRTPTFFLNGRMLEASSWQQLEPILQNAGARDE